MGCVMHVNSPPSGVPQEMSNLSLQQLSWPGLLEKHILEGLSVLTRKRGGDRGREKTYEGS